MLGIDPGSRITGYGIIRTDGIRHEYVASGCIRTNPDDVFPTKIKQIYDGVLEIIGQFSPDYFSIEEPFVAKNVQSSFKLCHARAAAMLAALNCDLPVAEYSPRTVKQAVAGYGNAAKEQIQEMIVRLYRLNKAPQADAADALAIATCHASSLRTLSAMRKGSGGVLMSGTSGSRIH